MLQNPYIINEKQCLSPPLPLPPTFYRQTTLYGLAPSPNFCKEMLIPHCVWFSKSPNLLINKGRFTLCLHDGMQQVDKSSTGQFSPEILF